MEQPIATNGQLPTRRGTRRGIIDHFINLHHLSDGSYADSYTVRTDTHFRGHMLRIRTHWPLDLGFIQRPGADEARQRS